MRPYRARRELSSPKHTVRPIASGPDEMMVGRSICCRVPDSRVVIKERLTPSLWKTESKIDRRPSFLHFMSSEGGLGTATYPKRDNNHA